MTTRIAAPMIMNGRISAGITLSVTGSTGSAGKGTSSTETLATILSSVPRPAATATWSRRASSSTSAAVLALALMVTATDTSVMEKEATSICSLFSLSLPSRSCQYSA